MVQYKYSQGNGQHPSWLDTLKNKFEKPLDKRRKVWYNTDTVKGKQPTG